MVAALSLVLSPGAADSLGALARPAGPIRLLIGPEGGLTPDVMIAPKLSPMGLFEFHRAAESIDLGRQATERVLPDILEMVKGADATVA